MPPIPHTLRTVLELARWAPSGDNTQCWRIEVVDGTRFVVHGFDTREHCVYDLDGRPSQVSLGAFLETARLAATTQGLALTHALRERSPEARPTFDVVLEPAPGISADPLAEAIRSRSVQRRALSTRPIDAAARATIERAVGSGWELRWFDGLAARWAWARMLWANAGLRLRLPEAFETHRSIIAWNARTSPDRVPDQALGASTPTLVLMQHALKSWERVHFLNTWLGGTLVPRLEMDLVPALACGAHVAILASEPPRTTADYVAAGAAVQRFWLASTKLGLRHQPAVTPLVFARYVREQRRFTAVAKLQALAGEVAQSLEALLGGGSPAERAVWLGRVGHGPPARARSERLSVEQLRVGPGGEAR